MPAIKMRMRLGKLTSLEKLLEVFVTQARANKLTLDYSMIADQAKQFTDPELGGNPSLALKILNPASTECVTFAGDTASSTPSLVERQARSRRT